MGFAKTTKPVVHIPDFKAEVGDVAVILNHRSHFRYIDNRD